ncbi:ABC transporter substrate-binding protein [Brachybacterium huguangmaarense]
MTTNSSRRPSRRGFLQASGALAVGAALVSSIAACAPRDASSGGSGSGSDAGGSGATANEDGTITAGISYELGTNGYDPMTTSAALTVAVNWHTMEGLTELHPVTREVYAALAEELPSAEGTSVDVALRDGAVFHDGTPVTADDVVFSFERVLDPANNSLYRTFIPFISGVEKKDDTTVTISMSEPTALLAERLSVVKIVPKAAVEADAKAFDAMPVGTGPYKMTDSGASSQKVVFERFDDYTGPQKARAKAMEWQIIPDPSTRTNALQSKTVAAIDSVPYLSIDQLKATDTVESVQGFGLLFSMFNQAPGNPFADVRNRQAFLYAIDMDKVIETALMGNAEAATCFLQSDHPDYKKAKTVYSLDAAKAKDLFSQTGLTSFRMLCTDHDWVQKVTPIIQESLTAAGVQVSFEQKKSADVYNTIDGKPEAYDVVIAPGDPSVFGNDPDLLMRRWYAADTWTDTRMHWKGTESYQKVQDLLGQGFSATDESAQKDAWGQLFDLISDEVPLYPLFHRKSPTAWSDDMLVDFEPISLTGLSFVGVASTK